MMDRLRYLSAALLSAIIVVFAYLNLHEVEIYFLAWDFKLSVSLLALGSFLAGLMVGYIGFLFGRRTKGRRREELPGPAVSDAAEVSDEEFASEITERLD